MKKTIISLALAAALVLGVLGIARLQQGDQNALISIVSSAAAATASADVDTGDYFSKRDLSGAWDEKDAVVMTLTGSVTITEAGVYVLSGTVADGTVTVDVTSDDKVQLVLNGVSIAASSSAAILVENADKVFITLAEGTVNTLTTAAFDESSDVDAVIFSRDDLTLNGAGTLILSSPKHGIVGKDDVKVTGGVYQITAEGRGIDANDSVRIAGGDFTIVSGKDTIRAKHDEADKGYVLIAGGSFNLTVGGGAASAARSSSYGNGFGGRQQQWGSYGGSSSSDTSDSMKAVKASGNLTILSGSFVIDAADDAIHSDSDILIAGGDFTISTGDDGMHANNALTIEDGTVNILQSYEGLEATSLTIAGGNISLIASDDGLNAAGGNDGSGRGWNDMFASDGSLILISGGNLYVNAQGDGIDSNGDLTITGGVIVVSGPTGSGNGALDKNGVAAITGGTVIAAGSSGMAETFGNTSTQASSLVYLNGQAGEIKVTDQSGKVILSGTVEKSFQTVVVSSPDMVTGQTYTLSCGSASATFTVGSSGNGFGGGFGGPGNRQQPGGGQNGSGGGRGR